MNMRFAACASNGMSAGIAIHSVAVLKRTRCPARLRVETGPESWWRVLVA
jgi:hypothetical protein